MQLTERHRKYWRANLRLTGTLLAIWFSVTFGVVWFARDLADIEFLDFPLPFWVGGQGALIVYVLLVRHYSVRMNELDETYGVAEGER
jgi:putative solute:sodium symporter small subunit